jgi:4-amino-4-deoxy-L-arabinose transferase-like glycosyltransferase
MAPGRWSEVPEVRENPEHPPLVKLVFGVAVRGEPEPAWETLKVGRPIPEAARPAFLAARWTSWWAGVAQLGVVGAVAPLGALLLAVEPYHAKYTAQAYLEAIPGLFALLAVALFERSIDGRGKRSIDRRPELWGSAVALGIAAAGKYPYGLVIGLAVAPLLVANARRAGWLWVAYGEVTLAAFALADPFLWPDPVRRLVESVGFHWGYSHGEHVARAGMPWYQSLWFLTHAAPMRWHAGIFATGVTAWVLLPLAVIGAKVAARRRPVWAAWALAGMLFLFVWPTKWPQYLLLVLPALCVCAAHAPEAAVELFRWIRARRRTA